MCVVIDHEVGGGQEIAAQRGRIVVADAGDDELSALGVGDARAVAVDLDGGGQELGVGDADLQAGGEDEGYFSVEAVT